MSIRLSLLSAKKPIERLSGDQNGYDAPSVPGRGRIVTASSGRDQSCVLPSGEEARNSSCRLSGEIANETGSDVDGVGISTRNSGVVSGALVNRKRAMPPAITATATPAASVATAMIAAIAGQN